MKDLLLLVTGVLGSWPGSRLRVWLASLQLNWQVQVRDSHNLILKQLLCRQCEEGKHELTSLLWKFAISTCLQGATNYLHVKVQSTGLVTEVELISLCIDWFLLSCSCIWWSWIRCDVVSEEAREDEGQGSRVEEIWDFEHNHHKNGVGIWYLDAN